MQTRLTDEHEPSPDRLRVPETPPAVPALKLGGLGVLDVGVLLHPGPAPEGLPAHVARGRRHVGLLGRGGGRPLAAVRRLHVQLEALPRQQPLPALVAEKVEAAAAVAVAVAAGLVTPVK